MFLRLECFILQVSSVIYINTNWFENIGSDRAPIDCCACHTYRPHPRNISDVNPQAILRISSKFEKSHYVLRWLTSLTNHQPNIPSLVSRQNILKIVCLTKVSLFITKFPVGTISLQSQFCCGSNKGYWIELIILVQLRPYSAVLTTAYSHTII